MPTTRTSLVGKRFGLLFVLSKNGVDNHRQTLWNCGCDCGNTRIVTTSNLTCGRAKSCGCSKKHMLPRGQANFNYLFSSYRAGAKSRGYVFELTKSWFRKITSRDCCYCGETPKQINHGGRDCYNGYYVYNGIDRLDNAKGYTRANSFPCCGTCNKMKGTLLHKEFLAHIRKIQSHQES